MDATTDEGNTASEEIKLQYCNLVKELYVKGYEIEKPVITFKDIAKARDFETVNVLEQLIMNLVTL